jgi:tetratricopeptide (TPR) repeat protein
MMTDAKVLASGSSVKAIDLTPVKYELQTMGGPISKDSQDRLEQVLQADPGNAEAHILLAFGDVNLCLYDLAREQCQQLVASAPSARQITALGNSLLRTNNTRLASMIFQAGAKRFPSDTQLLASYAEAMLKMQDRVAAKSIYEDALARSPKQVELRTALAELLLQEKAYPQALKLAEEEIKLRPDYNWRAWQAKGEALVGLRRYPEALRSFHKAYAQAPFALGIARAYGDACFWAGRYTEALEPLLAAVAFDSTLANVNGEDDSWTTHSNSSLVTAMRRVPPKLVSLKIADLSHRLDKIIHNAAFHFSVANILDQAGLHKLAIEQYLAGLKIYPDDPRALFALGRDLEDSGRYLEAEKYYEEIQKKRPGIQKYSEYLTRFKCRMALRQNDLSWQLKDWLRSHI